MVAGRTLEEDDLLEHAAFLAEILATRAGTVRLRLRRIHPARPVAGFRDPSMHCARLDAAVDGLERIQEAPRRTHLAIIPMLQRNAAHLGDGEGG